MAMLARTALIIAAAWAASPAAGQDRLVPQKLQSPTTRSGTPITDADILKGKPVPAPQVELSPQQQRKLEETVQNLGPVPETANHTRSIQDVTMPPFAWSGLLVSIKEGRDTVGLCTAQFIDPNVMMTAAHCVRDRETGQYSGDRYEYYLQYQLRRYKEKFDTFCVWTDERWVQTDKNDAAKTAQTWQYDYAFLYTPKALSGGQFTFDPQPANYKVAMSVGYPVALHEGKVIEGNLGRLFDAQELTGIPNVLGVAHGNLDHTQGSSGGAWVGVHPEAKTINDLNRLFSINSFGTSMAKGISFGPRLPSTLQELVEKVKAGGMEACTQ